MTTPARNATMSSTPLIGRRRVDGADVPGGGTGSRCGSDQRAVMPEASGSGGRFLFASGATPREPMATSVDASSQRLGNSGTYPSTPGTRIVGGQMVMPSPLLETKLYIPRVRRGLVTRPRLSERLSRRGESKLTLVSAPAGFGKTTLVAEWLAATPLLERRAAWLSLDPSDNRAASFWPYVIAALQTVVPERRRDCDLPAGVAPNADHISPCHVAERPQRAAARHRAGARRLPRRRYERHPGRDGIPH